MPRNVRNFWLELSVDGKRCAVATGPVTEDGGFTLRISQRDDGAVTSAGVLYGKVSRKGTLALCWEGQTTPQGEGTAMAPMVLNRTER